MKQLFHGLLVTALLAISSDAAGVIVREGFSGNWYDPAQSGHGIQLEVISPRQALVTWYTFDPTGEQLWLYGVGEISGDTVRAELARYEGGLFPPLFDPAEVQPSTWGNITLVFDDCRTGEMHWETDAEGFDDGSMPLRRLTGIHDTRCGAADIFSRSVTFSLGADNTGWEAVFADYPESQADNLEAEAEWTALPEPHDASRGFKLAGTNTPDDLAMFLKRPIDGLVPDTTYRVELEMTFASNEPDGCSVGIGGSPAHNVYVKLGAAGTEPVAERTDDTYRMNIDKGGGSRGGADALVVGNMATSQEGCPPIPERDWELKTVTTQGERFTATTDEEGRLWIYGGTDSGFEGRTTLFITEVIARLTPAHPES